MRPAAPLKESTFPTARLRRRRLPGRYFVRAWLRLYPHSRGPVELPHARHFLLKLQHAN